MNSSPEQVSTTAVSGTARPSEDLSIATPSRVSDCPPARAPISAYHIVDWPETSNGMTPVGVSIATRNGPVVVAPRLVTWIRIRSEERRVGKEGRYRSAQYPARNSFNTNGSRDNNF